MTIQFSPLQRLLGLLSHYSVGDLARLAYYRTRPRFRPGRARVGGYEVEFPDAASYVSNRLDIFSREIYRFETARASPRIVDVGGHIGLATLYFKRLFPDARITAIEADPATFSYLKRNVEHNALADVTVLNRVAGLSEGPTRFFPNRADGGTTTEIQGVHPIEVPSIDLRSLLHGEPIAFLKMDIEGSESTVVPECLEGLRNVEHVFIEYHSRSTEGQRLDRILQTLTEAGFRYFIESHYRERCPLVSVKQRGGMDLQTNIFGRRLSAQASDLN